MESPRVLAGLDDGGAPMTCGEIDDLIDMTGGDLGADLQVTEHLNQCRGCRALMVALGELRQRPVPRSRPGSRRRTR